MARLSKPELFHVVENAIRESGWNFFHLSQAGQHPARYQLYRNGHSHRTRVYIWNVSHGGGAARPVDEYRIQITGVSRFEPEVGGKTLILGWWDEVGVFAGFDYQHHLGTLGYSPSMQIREAALRTALSSGFSPHKRGRHELAIAFRPDFFGTYVEHLETLHECGEAPAEIEVLTQIGEDPDAIDDASITETVVENRRYAVTSTRRALRDISFRARVLNAYGNRCAVCGVQLKLLDGAHILPVSHPDSTDETCNGVALCALHHRAYDRALITFDPEYRTHLNAGQVDELRGLGLDGGLETFEAAVRPILILPPDRRDRPRDHYVSAANAVRGWHL